jgi:predicted nucleic acid-binding protein
VILTDAGPLVALLDCGEPDHVRCREALERLHGPMLTTWPTFTEAMSLLGEAGGWIPQEALWRLLNRRDLLVEMPHRLDRVEALMSRYRTLPMDLADASLVALAEARGLTTVFTLDQDFRVYRLPGGKAFTLVP